MNVIKDIIKLENTYIYSDYSNISLYDDMENEDNIELFNNIFEVIKKNKRKIIKDTNLEESIQNINKKFSINFDNFDNLKKTEDIIFAYLTIFTILSLNLESNKILSEDSLKLNTISDCCNKTTYFYDKFRIFLIMKHDLNISKLENRNVTKIFYILISEKIINEQNIYKDNKTIKLIFIKNMNYISIKEIYTNNFKQFEYNNEIWLYNDSFWSLKKIFKENLKSGERFHLGDKDLINKLCNNYFYIDLDNLTEIYYIFLNENKINRKDIKEDYKKLIEEYSINIFNKNKSGLISKKISIYLKCFIFENIIKNYKNNVKYFIPFIIDFRGRKYDLTDISPTFFTELRYCLHLGEYDMYKDLKNHFLKEKIDNIMLQYCYLIDKKFKSDDKLKNISFIWLLISLAEPFKNKMGSKVSIEKFIKKGLEILDDHKMIELLEYDDKIKCIYIKKILNELINNIFIKRLIPKDATASVFQHLVKCLGEFDDNSLKYCNMNSEEFWYDTYSIIIEKFNIKIKKHITTLTSEKYERIFNRKNLKKIMMTKNYGCGLKKSFKYFKQSIKDLLYGYNGMEINEINVIFVKFYNHISKENQITKSDVNKIIDFFKDNKKITFNDSSKTSFEYKKFKNNRIDSSYNNERYTRIIKEMSEEDDKKKYRIAIVANYIQSQDASLVRWVLNRIIIITIHDCFMIDYMNISYLIALINEGMGENFHSIINENNKKVFSIFIII
jgi:hypothetical protein